MFRTQRVLPALAALLALAIVPSCNSSIDKASGPNVVLEVENVTIPPVNATVDATTGTCTVTLTNSTATFKNKPKNSLGSTSPFNDIILKDVIVTYIWDDNAGVAGPTVFGVGGSVAANGSSTAQFGVVTIGDITGTSRFGHSATLTLTFEGETVSGEPIQVVTGGTLSVGSCG